MQAKQKRTKLVNAFGWMGYFTNALQWFWALIILGYPLFIHLAATRPAAAPSPQAPKVDFSFSPEVSIVVAAVVTIIMAAVTIVSLVIMPKTLGSTTKKVTEITTAAILPVMTQHKKISPKRRQILTIKTRFGLKMILWLVPLFAVYFAPQYAPLPYEIITTLSWFLAGITVLDFGLQYLLAYLMAINYRYLV